MMTETVVTVDPNRNADQQPKPTATTNLGWIRINFNYFITIPGIMKLMQVVFGILCMALASPARIGGTHWFLFVVVTSFIATIIWCFVYLLSLREVLNIPINWILTELINTGIIVLLYFIAFIVQLAEWSHMHNSRYKGVNIAAGVFGIFNTIVYVAGAYFLYLEQRQSGTTS